MNPDQWSILLNAIFKSMRLPRRYRSMLPLLSIRSALASESERARACVPLLLLFHLPFFIQVVVTHLTRHINLCMHVTGTTGCSLATRQVTSPTLAYIFILVSISAINVRFAWCLRFFFLVDERSGDLVPPTIPKCPVPFPRFWVDQLLFSTAPLPICVATLRKKENESLK